MLGRGFVVKRKLSVCDEYREQIVGVLGALGKDEALLDASRASKNVSSSSAKEQFGLAKSIVLKRKMLAFLFFTYLLEDEYD